jgi:hypothetical protein
MLPFLVPVIFTF